LPGNGLAQHSMLYVGENYTKMFLVNDGKVIWTYQTGPGYEYDDVWMLSNGNILFTRMQYVAEITPDKKVVWRYDCNNSTGTNHTEVHTCQPIGLDRVMFVVNGLPPRLMIVNTKTGAVEVNHEVPSADGQPFNPKTFTGSSAARAYTAQGTYLLSYLSSGNVVEYDKDFNKIWSYGIKSPWAAIRLKNGNTLITDEADSLTREVNPKGETVWEFKNTDLPEAYRLVSKRRKAAPVWPTATRSSPPAAARQRPAARRSHPGQKGRLGAARLARPRRRHRRANPGRSGHP
jgi:hypothetical protein